MLCYGNGSIYRAVSTEAGTKYGINPTVVIYDELAQAKNRELYDALDTSMAARSEPLFTTISTQSNDPNHILSQLIDDGLSGLDPTTICHLYAVPDDAPDVFTDQNALSRVALGVRCAFGQPYFGKDSETHPAGLGGAVWSYRGAFGNLC